MLACSMVLVRALFGRRRHCDVILCAYDIGKCATTIAPRYFFVYIVVATILLYTIFIINNVQHIEDVIGFSESM